MSHLTEGQRYEIQVLNKLGQSQKEIALYLGRHKSVISRELSRNCDLRIGEHWPPVVELKEGTWKWIW